MVLSGQLRAPVALNPGKMNQYQRGSKLARPQSRSGAIWRREKSLGSPIVQRATYSLYRLSYLGFFRLPNNVTLFEEYKLQSPSLEFSKQSCISLPVSCTETFLAAPRCHTLLCKSAAESEAEYLK